MIEKGKIIVRRGVNGFSPDYWRVEWVGRVTVKAKNVNTHEVCLIHIDDVRVVPEKKNADFGGASLNDLTLAAQKIAKLTQKVGWVIPVKNESSDGARIEKGGRVGVFARVRGFFGRMWSYIRFLWLKWRVKERKCRN